MLSDSFFYNSKSKELVKAVGDLAWALKFKENVLDESTNFKVRDHFERYFESSMVKLNKTIDRRRYAVRDLLYRLDLDERIEEKLLDQKTRQKALRRIARAEKEEKSMDWGEFSA